jgi:uncharacterized membrane protein
VTDQAESTRPSSALLAGVPAAVGVVVSFVVAIVLYAGIDGKTITSISGLDHVIGAPSVAISIIVFSVFVAWIVGQAAGARYGHRLSVAAIVVASLGTVYQLLAVILNFSWFAVVLLVAAAATLLFTIVGCRAAKAADAEPQLARADRPRIFGVALVIAGIGGLLASFNLSVDKVTAAIYPSQTLNCTVSATTQCLKNLESWQGSLFGFPNPLIGLGGFAVVLLIGVTVLAGACFPRWWWIAFNIGVVLAMAFIVFLIIESVYVIATLCLWCALVYFVLIPTFWLVTLRNLSVGNFRVGPSATKFFAGAYTWVPLITLVCYVIVFLLFQTRLDILTGL